LVMDQPKDEIKGLIAHRLRRESKVVERLGGRGEIALMDLTPLVYDDVDAGLHTLASYSLLAHLLKLEKEQRVSRNNENWCLLEA
jgi:hypothetical protein